MSASPYFVSWRYPKKSLLNPQLSDMANFSQLKLPSCCHALFKCYTDDMILLDQQDDSQDHRDDIPPANPDEAPPPLDPDEAPPANPDEAPPPLDPDEAPPANPDEAPPPLDPDEAPPANPDEAPPPLDPDEAPPANPDDAPSPLDPDEAPLPSL